MDETPDRTRGEDPVAVLCLDADDEYRSQLASYLNDVEGLHAVPVAAPATALARLPEADCLVSALSLPDQNGFDVLSAVRERTEELPFVLHTSAPPSDVVDRLFTVDNTDYVRKDADAGTIPFLARRIQLLVERHRFSEMARRLAVAVDTSREPMLVVVADGRIEYANGQFAAAVAAARADLRGRPWTDVFAQDATERLQHEIVPVGTEGWTWTGRTVLSPRDGVGIDARTDVAHLEDGSMVFVFRDLDQAIAADA